MKNVLRKKIDKIVKDLFKIELLDYSIEVPVNKNFGDYSTNIAFVLAKELNKSPKEIANAIVGDADPPAGRAGLRPLREIQKIEIAGGGFINFFISENILIKELKKILKEKKRYGSNNLGKGKKIQLEFISANPTGPLTLGNGRGGFTGDTLVNILQKSGFDIQREYYVNDAGRQVKVILAKSIRKALGLEIVGARHDLPAEEEIYGGDYIDKIARRIRKEKGIKWIESEYEKTGEMTASIILDEMIKKDMKSFGIKFDKFQSEKSFFSRGLIDKMWKFLTKKGFIYEKDGAYWLKTSDFGDEKDRVVKTTEGEFTYLMSDIAYLYDRFSIRKFNRVLVMVGADHHGYVGRWQAAAKILGYEGKLEILIFQLVRVIREGKEARMSKRKGIYIALAEIVEEIGIDAARYFFITRDLNSHMDIDLDLAKEESAKNPVYYIQYASARMYSILAKLKTQNLKLKAKVSLRDGLNIYEFNLIKKIIQFPDVVGEIAKSYQVHDLANYTLELAGAFHKFYDNCRILGDEKEKERLITLKAAKIVLENCLGLMGIEAKEKM